MKTTKRIPLTNWLLWVVLLAFLGNGCKVDKIEEIKEIIDKAREGDAAAQFNLGFYRANGQGGPTNYVAAANWYRKAAEQNHAKAQYNLSLSYAEGRGVTWDFVEAYKWLFLSAAQGFADAKQDMTHLDATLSQEQIKEGKRRANDWLEQRKADVRHVEPWLEQRKAEAYDVGPPWFAIATSVLLAPIVAGFVTAFLCRLFTSRQREPSWAVAVFSILLGAMVVPAIAVIFDIVDWFGFSLYVAVGIAAVVAIIIVGGSRGEYERRLSSAAGALMGLRHHRHHRHRKPWLSLIGSSLMVIVATSFLIVRLSSFGRYDGTFVAPNSARPFDTPGGKPVGLPDSPTNLRLPGESRWEKLKVLYPSRLNLSEETEGLLPLSMLALLIGGTWLGFTVWGWSDDVRRRVNRHDARWSEFG